MKISQVALSILGTLAVAGYLLATEWPFWERWTKDDESSKSSRSTKKDRKERKRSRKSAKDIANKSNEGPPTPAAPGKTYRTGPISYWIDKDCDCSSGYDYVLETVEFTSDRIIATILNSKRKEIAAYPPGDENAHFLLEWRYVDNGRPRHDLKEVREIATYPAYSTPLHFQLVFPRISDEAEKFQISGHATSKLDYFPFASVDLSQEMTKDELERYDGYRRCGFDFVSAIPKDHDKAFRAHRAADRSGFSWSTSSELSIKGSTSGDQVTVHADREGRGEVCMQSTVAGKSCRSCQVIEIGPTPSTPEPDFRMKTCGGIPSKEPHWQFEVVKPSAGTSYEWEISQGHILKDSGRERTMVMRTNYRPGSFTVTLNTNKGGKRNSYSRDFHTIYSCMDPD
jgi:hypothetical protein